MPANSALARSGSHQRSGALTSIGAQLRLWERRHFLALAHVGDLNRQPDEGPLEQELRWSMRKQPMLKRRQRWREDRKSWTSYFTKR